MISRRGSNEKLTDSRERGIVLTLIVKMGREDFIQACRRKVAERARSAIVRLKGCKNFCHHEFIRSVLPKSIMERDSEPSSE